MPGTLSPHCNAAVTSSLPNSMTAPTTGGLPCRCGDSVGLIPCGKNADILRVLEDAGFIETVKVGKYTRKEEERLASEYRLTDHRCDVTGELPSRRYNPQHRWKPGEAPPKPKPALTDAERQRRSRKKRRHECHAERPYDRDGTVPITGTDVVTGAIGAGIRPRKTAKNQTQSQSDVTLSVPPTGTLIHLTMGGASLEGTSVTPLVTASREETTPNQG